MINILRDRRSVRKYKNQKIEPGKIDILKESALRAPTSKNRRPWRFIFVQDEDTLLRLSQCKPHGAAFLKNAPVGIVVCAHSEESDVWIEDTSIASIILQLTAQSLNLGSCWIQIRERFHDSGISSSEYISDVLKLGKDIVVESIISIGYPDETRTGVPFDDLEMDKILEI